MFRHQTHPYQTTGPPPQPPRPKYPWLENSSAEESQYAEPPRWGARSPDSPVYHAPYPVAPSPPHPQYPPQLPPAARSPAPSDVRVPGGCGGHCPAFEYVCYYVLQIIFVIGILTGISLCIAGSVLRRSNRGGDLGVLVYIGCLAAMVCAVLLGVQCCVRRKNKQRCKQMRMRTAPPDCIPLDTIPNIFVGEHNTMPIPPRDRGSRQMQPLLHPSAPMIASTLPRNYYIRPERRREADSIQCEEINGVPWWRRQ